MFLYENVPQLKYHNPSIEFSVQRHNEEDSKIEIVSGMLMFTAKLKWPSNFVSIHLIVQKL